MKDTIQDIEFSIPRDRRRKLKSFKIEGGKSECVIYQNQGEDPTAVTAVYYLGKGADKQEELKKHPTLSEIYCECKKNGWDIKQTVFY